jgi:hypothetical protein
VIPGSTVENVLVGGRARGYVMRRSPHFVVWSESAEELHVQGVGQPWTEVTQMWEGPREAAISADEQWCVVIGLGFVAFRLSPVGEVRSHWRRPFHERWELQPPMKGDLAGAVLFTGLRALDAHRFALSTVLGLGNMWTRREWIYDADADTIGEPRDIVDEEKRRRAVRPERSAELSSERQLAAAQRGDGAETTAEAGRTFEPHPKGGETVLSKGDPVGYVLCRSPRFVVWQEIGSMVCVEGEGLPWLLLDDMFGGARAAAISDDEEWCVVVGCGLRARRLRLGGEFRTHGADAKNLLWLSKVEAHSGHTFTVRGGAAGFVVREYLYDADRDELRQQREWVDEGRRRRTGILTSFCGQKLSEVETSDARVRLAFGDAGELAVTIAEEIRLEEKGPGAGIGALDLRVDAQRARAAATLRGWLGHRVLAVSVEEAGGIRFQMHATQEREAEPLHRDWFGITAPRSSPGSWTVSSPLGRLDAPSEPACT